MRDQNNLLAGDWQLASGSGGGGGGGRTTVTVGRSTPAEDVIDAISRLNRALEAAARANWNVNLSLAERSPTFFDEGATYTAVAAIISKAI